MDKQPAAPIALGLVALAWVPLVVMGFEGLRCGEERGPDGMAMPRSGLTLVFSDGALVDALLNSAAIAIAAATFSTALVALNTSLLRMKAARRGSRRVASPTIRGLAAAALLIPELALAVGTAALLVAVGAGRSLAALIYIHTMLGFLVALPLGLTLTDRISLDTERAAMDCGCDEVEAVWRTTFPAHRRLFLVLFVVAAMLSFEDFVLALFVAPSGASTLPLYIYSLVKFRRVAEANALGVILVVVSLFIGALLRRLIGGLPAQSEKAKEV